MSADTLADGARPRSLSVVTQEYAPQVILAVAACPTHAAIAGQPLPLPTQREGRTIVMSGAHEPKCPCRR